MRKALVKLVVFDIYTTNQMERQMSQKRSQNRARNHSAKRKRARRVAQNLRQKTIEAKTRRSENINDSVDQKLKVRQAEQEPRPAPTARAYFLAKMWESFKLDQALEQVGIYKDSGVPMSTIFMVVIMMGIMGATSLNNLAALIAQDATLAVLFGLEMLNEKQLYRGLGTVEIDQYQNWMKLFIKSLQADPKTRSRANGAVAGDTTQIEKRYSHKIPGVHVIFLHSEKRFTRGIEAISTHYVDEDKDYPLFIDFYRPSQEAKAARQEELARKKVGVDARKPAEVLNYLTQLITQDQRPQLVVLSGSRLNMRFRQGVEQLGLFWLGVSDNRRVYVLDGQDKSAKAKQLVLTIKADQWISDADAGYRYAFAGLATSSIGRVRLIVAEQMADGVKTLYLAAEDSDLSLVYEQLSNLLIREKGKQESGILFQMLELLKLSRESGIIAENATFDSWFCVPWFISAVLELGFRRVVTKPKANFNYIYKGEVYKLSQLWDLLTHKEFEEHEYKGKTYQLAELLVEMGGLGKVKLVFARQLSRRGNKELQFVLMCTDSNYQKEEVLKIYKLRWKIEVFYREVKQHHCFGHFHSQNSNTNFGQTMLSVVAYSFVQLHKLLQPSLKEKTLGWIQQHYLSVIVNLVEDLPGYFIEFPSWLMDFGLPDWSQFRCIDT